MTYELLELDDEKDIQAVIQAFLEREKFGPIVEENFLGREPKLQQHQFVLIDILKERIDVLNARLMDGAYQEDRQQILSLILEDFLSRFDTCRSNVDIHDLVFGRNKRSITLTRHNGTLDTMVEYRVVDTDYETDCRNNLVTVIKEKVIRVTPGSDEIQKPDFAIYMNGIPFIAVEVKNPTRTAGIHAALKDYRRKTTYHKFLACLCTDGNNAGLSANPNATSVDNWKAYGQHRRHDRDSNGLFDLVEELVFNVRNMTFYFQYGLFTVGNDKTGAVALGNLRVHQYFVTKAAIQRVESSVKGEVFREVVKQPPRSGKTIAIRSIISVIADRFSGHFDKILIQVPDLTITEQFYKGFSGHRFSNGYRVRKIDGRWKSESASFNGRISYEEAVTESGRGIYVMNMQKISEEMREFVDDTSRVLIFIDEVHTHQRGINADVRERNFPNASYFTFTATPRKRREGRMAADLTLMDYSSSDRYLDELMNEDAKELNLVVPVVYEKAPYKVDFEEDNARKLSALIESEVRKKIEEDPDFADIMEAIEERSESYMERLLAAREEGGNDTAEIACKVEQYRHNLINEKADRFIGRLKEEFKRRQKIDQIPNVVQHVVKDLRAKVEDNYSETDIETGRKAQRFFPKAFLVVDNQSLADEVARYITLESGGTNSIGGFKFGLDYSESMDFDGGRGSLMQAFNKIRYGDSIKDDFDAQADDSTSILIVVGKYLMGYDNKQLVAVYCYTSIQEPARIFQLYTRSATKFEGKELGFFVDLSFGNENFDAYNEAMRWYEGGSEGSVLYLTEDQIEQRKQSLWRLFDRLAGILRMERRELIRPGKERSLFIAHLDAEQQGHALRICREIGQGVKNLLSPKYYREFLDYILTINKALYGLVNHLQASSKMVIFSNKDISALLDEFLGILNLSVSDIMNIELIDGKIIKTRSGNGRTQSVVSRQLAEVRHILRNSRGFMGGDIFERLRRMANDIDEANDWDEETERRSTELLDESRRMINGITKMIQTEYDGRAEWYVTHSVFRNYLEAKGVSLSGDDHGFIRFAEKYSTVLLGYVTRNTRGGNLDVSDSIIRDAYKKLGELISDFNRGEDQQAFYKTVYRVLAVEKVRHETERLIGKLFKQVYEKTYGLQQYS